MHVAVALLLIGSTIELPPLPKGLPPAQMTPCEDCCKEKGVWLPLARADAVDLQRQRCKVLPDRCEAALEVERAQGELDKRLAKLEGLEEAGKGQWLDRLTWGIGGLVVGGLIALGFSIGHSL